LRLGNVLECTGNVQGPSKNVEPTAGLHLGFCKKEKKRKPSAYFVCRKTGVSCKKKVFERSCVYVYLVR